MNVFKKTGEAIQRIEAIESQLSDLNRKISDTNMSIKQISDKVETGLVSISEMEAEVNEAHGLIKIPSVRIGTEGHVQLLAEKIESVQARLDVLSRAVSELK